MLCLKGDGDSKWSVHYTTQKPPQGLFFIPGKRQRSADDLQACNGLTQHGPASSHRHQPSPAFSPSASGLNQSEASTHRGWKNKSPNLSSASSGEEERFVLNNTRPLTPLILNPINFTSCWDGFAPAYEPAVGAEMEPTSRLPTPEERMRQQAETVGTNIVPINVTGESFDRQANFRRMASNADSLSWRPCNLSRHNKVTGIPDGVSQKPDSPLVSSVLPGQFSTVDQPVSSSCTSAHQQNTTEEEVEVKDRAEIRKEGQTTVRRIRSPKEGGMASLMASLTSSPRFCSSSLESQDLQGFPSDFQPLLPFDPTARVTPLSPFSSSSFLSSSPVTSSIPGSPSCVLRSEWSYPNDKSLNEAALHHTSTSSSHYLSSSSITDSEFCNQVLDDQAAAQHNAQCSNSGGSYSCQPGSPNSSVHCSQTRGDWSSMTQETRCASGEGWSCDPLPSSGRSSPASTDSNSLCSEKSSSSPLLNREKRKSSPPFSCCRTVTRSISLRKSKCPPLPPLRSDSLRRRPGRTKPSRSSSSPRLERTTQQTPTLSPHTFHDPWVPQSNTKRHQNGFNCGTIATFEPLSPDGQAAAPGDSPSSEHLSLSSSHSHAHVSTPGSPGLEEEGCTLSPQPAASSVAGLQRLASPSSGYSSQSNTPTPGTPVSSPLSPSSPGAFSLPLTSPSSSSHSLPLSPPVSSLPQTKSRGKGRPKPPVPERKSSLLSSRSSSFSSTSSLSSCTSSEHPLLSAPPLPPSPPPLLPSSSLPTPPPLPPSSRPPPPPYSYAIRQSCHHALESTMSSSTNFPPPSSSPLPPPSELPESSLAELPPPLPPPTLPPLSTSSPTPPPSTLGKCQKHCAKLATPPHPLVTAQALQGVKLRSVKKQEGQLTSTVLVTAASADATLNNQAGMLSASANHANTSHHLPSKEACPDCAVANARLDGMTSTDGKPAGPGSHSAVSSLSSSEATGSHGLARADAKQPGLKLDHDSCNLTQTMMRTPNNESTHASLQSPPDIVRNPANQRSPGSQGATEQERNERAMYAVLANSGHSSPGSHWEKTSYGTDKNHISKIIQLSSSQHQQARDTVLTDTVPTESAEKQWNTEDAGHKDTSYWTLSGTNRGSHRESKRMLSESKDEVDTDDKNSSEKWSHRAAGGDSTADTDANQSNSIFKPRGQGKLRSPEKPVPPKKPDLCILVSPEARRGQITAPPAHPGCTPLHTQHAPSPKHLACTSGETTTPDQSLTHTTSPAHSVSTPVDVTTDSPSSSPKMQKPPNIYSKPDLSVTSPRTTTPRSAPKNPGEEARGTSGTYGTLESSGASQTQSTTGTQGTCSTLGKSGASGATSTQIGRTDWHRAEILRTRADDERIFHKRMMRSSLAEDEEEDEKERVEQRGMNTTVMMMSSFTKKKDRAKKRRKRRVGRQLLMMSPKMELSPSSSTSLSSSSSSSSSGDERDVVKDRIMPTEKVRMMTEVCDEESSDSESSCALNHHSRSSLCSAVSTGSLQGKLSLPHRLIQENEEERRGQEAQESKAAPGSKLGSLQSILPEQEALPIRHDVFLGVSADQMFVSGQPRTTEDLFAVIHRSKRKMLGRRASEEDRHCIMSSSSSSSSSLPVAPADPLPLLTKPAALTSQRSMRSESFKALLLKKGTRSDASLRISAVERLCRVSASASTTVSSLPPPADQPQHTPTGLCQDIDAHLTLDVPLSPTSLCTQNFPVTLGLRQRDLTQNHLLFTSSSPVFFLSSSSSMRPRSLTPPCFTSRRFAARCHLYVTPMTAISEGECEEEQEEDKAFETPGAEGELSPRLVEIS